jgi:hypothetical protein
MNGITLKASEKIASKEQCYLGSTRQTHEVSAYHDENNDGMLLIILRCC